MKRREVIQGITAVVGAAAVGCGRSADSASTVEPTPTSTPTATPTAMPSPTPTPPVLSPAELLSGIDTIVVLCMENRSFDHFLGSRKFIEGRAVDGLTGMEWNPAPAGGAPVFTHQLDDFTPEDPPHGWDKAHAQWNGGANDGFVIAHAGPTQNDAMGYHVRSQLAATYALADQFAVCDRWFCSVLGPTWPNRFYLHGATSGGIKKNDPLIGMTSVFNLLGDAGLSSKTYFHDLAWQAGYFNFNGLVGIEQFFQDAQGGTLPNFSFIDPKFFGADANDDHPDHDIQLGQALIASIYAALSSSPQWPRTLFVITYDENGGFYDHAAPPTIADQREEFRQQGFRVPALVAGGMVKAGSVISTTFDHASILSTLGVRHGFTPLNERMAAAADLSSCIDPALVVANQVRIAPRIAPITVSLDRVRQLMAKPRDGRHDQPELADLANRGEIPRQFDRRHLGPEITRRVLDAGAKLGAVRLID